MKTLPFLFVFDKGGHILLLHRIDRKTREPVKWWIESWETPAQGIIRELYEETGKGIELWELGSLVKSNW